MAFHRSVRVGLAALCCAASLSLAGAASADIPDCVDDSTAQNVPDCTVVTDDSTVEDGFGDGFGAVAGFFGVFFVLVVGAGIGTAIWRVRTARRIAEDAGLDPDTAASVALLDEHGLSTAYLTSNLHPRQPAAPAAPAEPAGHPTSADRLAELKDLLDKGLVTQAEYDERRTAIIDSV